MTNYPQLMNDVSDEDVTALIKTNRGDITLKLFPEYAPDTVRNFVEHAENQYYDGVIFHRVISDFMVQAGDPTGTGTGGESIYGRPFQDEFSPYVFNLYGALSMANAGPNTNGSQFFIVTANQTPDQMINQMEAAGYPDEIINAYRETGGTPWLDQKHTVFGHVVEGMDVVLEMEKAETDYADKPIEDITIEGIEVNR